MSAFDKFLASLNPIGNAEAEPLMYGAPGYPYGNDTKAALALGHGASDEDIWKKFGLYKSPMANGGNALVGEVIDSGASLNPGKARNIGDALNHPALFSNYPDLAKIPVNLTRYSEDKLPAERGAFLAKPQKSIDNANWYDIAGTLKELNKPVEYKTSITANYATDAQKQSTLLHELTHAIQRTYGLATGADGDKEAPRAYTDSKGEEQARMTQVRALMTPEQRANESPKTTIENMRKHGLNQFSVIQKLLENSANEK